MTVSLISINPTRSKLGSGTYLVKQLKEIGKVQRVSIYRVTTDLRVICNASVCTPRAVCFHYHD
jgi:hypothetical protein